MTRFRVVFFFCKTFLIPFLIDQGDIYVSLFYDFVLTVNKFKSKFLY